MRSGLISGGVFQCAECGRYDVRRSFGSPPWLQHPDRRGMWCGCELAQSFDDQITSPSEEE